MYRKNAQVEVLPVVDSWNKSAKRRFFVGGATQVVTVIMREMAPGANQCISFYSLYRPFLTRNIFDKYLGCLGPKKLSKIFLENIVWEIWEASYGSEIFFSLFDGGM